MANDDDDLKLNSLNRFAKKSPRLAYEEYSHCEVPAGCGGVVMRWTDPTEGFAAIVRGALAGRFTGFLDGAQLDSTRVVIPYGDHVLAFALERDPAPAGGRAGSAVLFAACITPDVGRMDDALAIPGGSTTDGTWRVLVADESPEGWRDPAFDDSDWGTLAAAPNDAFVSLPEDDPHRWRLREVSRCRAWPVLLPDGPRLWIRKRFSVVKP